MSSPVNGLLDHGFSNLKEAIDHYKNNDLRLEELETLMERANRIMSIRHEGAPKMFQLPAHYRMRLSKPFPAAAIGSYRGNAKLSTIKSAFVYERLNEVFGVMGWDIEHHIVGFFMKPVLKYKEKDKQDGETKYWTRTVLMIGRIYLREFDLYTPWQYSGDDIDTYDFQSLEDVFKGCVTSIVSKCAGNFLEVGIQVFKGNPESQEYNVARRVTNDVSTEPTGGTKPAANQDGEGSGAPKPESTKPAGKEKAQAPVQQEVKTEPFKYDASHATLEFLENEVDLMNLEQWIQEALGIDPATLNIRTAKNGISKAMAVTWFKNIYLDKPAPEEKSTKPAGKARGPLKVEHDEQDPPVEAPAPPQKPKPNYTGARNEPDNKGRSFSDSVQLNDGIKGEDAIKYRPKSALDNIQIFVDKNRAVMKEAYEEVFSYKDADLLNKEREQIYAIAAKGAGDIDLLPYTKKVLHWHWWVLKYGGAYEFKAQEAQEHGY